MRITFDKDTQLYEIIRVSETELQILNRAFEYDRPFTDIPQLDMYSKHIQDALCEAHAELLERYK